MELLFRDWVKDQTLNEGIIDKLQELIPVMAKYLPYALPQIQSDPELRVLFENKSALMALYRAMNRVGDPALIDQKIQEMESVKRRLADPSVKSKLDVLKDLSQYEVKIRESLLPYWRIIVRTLDFFHITPLITEAIPKFGEFVGCLTRYQTATNEEQKSAFFSCALAAFKQFLHQLISTSMFSGVAAKVLLILGKALGSILLLQVGGALASVVLLVWGVLIILGYAKDKITNESVVKLIKKIMYFFAPHEHKKRPPIFPGS